jgi:hypothetical protein
MEASSISLASARPVTRASAVAVPWHIYAVLFASACVIVGVMWDISWHSTIGRDSFWTPAHMAIYLGGVVAGLACGWLVLRTTFAGTDAERTQGVRFWRYFYGPLGAWLSIWGTFAMLTSAPFDDWWHNAYGLDVKILSPPHTLLALGIASIQFGALLMTLALQNRDNSDTRSHDKILYALAAGLLFVNASIMASEYTRRVHMHQAFFYEVVCGVFPLYLVALARGSRLRWPATTIAAVYTGLVLAMVWILPLFPATPRLGPIYQKITHMVPPDFPLLVIFPAIALDLIMRRWQKKERRWGWGLALALGGAFAVVFFAAQWNFGYFLNSPYARNWVFATDNYYYGLPKATYTYRHEFPPTDLSVHALLIIVTLSILSARVGLWCGDWLRRVRR